MAKQYLLPCECGQTIPVTAAQAGRTLACECGRENKVPTLAGLQQLEPVALPEGKSQPTAQWSSTRGILFVVGVILALVGLGIGGYGSYVLRRIDLQKVQQYTENVENMQLNEIERMTPVEAYEVWQKIREIGPGETGTSLTAQAQSAYDFSLRMTTIGFGAAALGICMAAGSLVGVRSRS
jgi:hypothetical protein